MKIRTGLVFIASLLLFGCSQKLSPQEGTQRLIGSYALHVGHECQDKGIETATLALHSNGTYSQEGKFKSGNSFYIDGKKWSYDGGGNVFLFDLKIYDPPSGNFSRSETHKRKFDCRFPEAHRNYLRPRSRLLLRKE